MATEVGQRGRRVEEACRADATRLGEARTGQGSRRLDVERFVDPAVRECRRPLQAGILPAEAGIPFHGLPSRASMGSMTAPSPELRVPRGKRRLDGRQWLVLIAPMALMAVTYPVFRLADAMFGGAVGGQLAWFAGMTFYWVVWGGAFSRWVLGRRRALELIRPRRPTTTLTAHVAFVVAMAAAVRFLVPGTAYDKPTAGVVLLLVISTFANGLFEELLWRGVYLDVFPRSRWLRVMWPSVWFGLWHLVPGSISADGPHVAMVIGPVLMGLYLAFLAKKTGSVWWPILAHTLGGLVMIS